MVGHHTPDETGKFSCSSNYSERSGLSGGNGAIFSFQSFIAFVGIENHFGMTYSSNVSCATGLSNSRCCNHFIWATVQHFFVPLNSFRQRVQRARIRCFNCLIWSLVAIFLLPAPFPTKAVDQLNSWAYIRFSEHSCPDRFLTFSWNCWISAIRKWRLPTALWSSSKTYFIKSVSDYFSDRILIFWCWHLCQPRMIMFNEPKRPFLPKGASHHNRHSEYIPVSAYHLASGFYQNLNRLPAQALLPSLYACNSSWSSLESNHLSHFSSKLLS